MTISQEDRVLIGNLARENFEMLFCDLGTMDEEQQALYAEVIRTEALKKSPPPEIKSAPSKLPSSEFAMSDEECRKFEKQSCPFKKHKDETVDSIMASDRQYLVWVSENCDGGFARDLQRYLANPAIAREMSGDLD